MSILSMPRLQYLDADGVPYPSAKASFYLAGTNTPAIVYTDDLLTTPHPVAITQDGSGYFPPIYVNPDDGDLKLILTDEFGANSRTIDPVTADRYTPTVDELAVILNPRSPAELAAGVIPANYAYEFDYIERHGADTASTNNIAAVNKAISVATVPASNVHRHQMRSGDGTFIVDTPPTNPYGVDLERSGAIMERFNAWSGTWFRQLNSYANHRAGPRGVGKEYLYHLYNKLIANPGTGIFMEIFGDSTVAGGFGESSSLLVQNSFFDLAVNCGLPEALYITNHAAGGTSWTDFDPTAVLASGTMDVLLIKYGVNDGGKEYATRLELMTTTMRTKLAQIRAHANGSLDKLSIVLVGPTSTYDIPSRRDTYWYEQVRHPYVQAARDFQCLYIDAYAMLQDARYAAGLDMDAPYADDRSVHPLNERLMWLWPAVFREIFGWEETRVIAKNKDINLSGQMTFGAAGTAILPSAFPFGRSWYKANTSDGWPLEGAVLTQKQADGVAFQTFVVANAGGATKIGRRIALVGGNSWSILEGIPQALTYQNGWNTLATYNALTATLSSGVVTVEGTIAGGTTTIATAIATLPVGMRPTSTAGPFVCATNAGTCKVQVSNAGVITFVSAGDATYTAVSLRFAAA